MAKNKAEKMDLVTKESMSEALASMESGRQAVKNNVSPVVVHKEVREMSWDAFRATGLLTFIRAYPMRTTWRGFKEETWTTAYGKISDYMAENADKIRRKPKMDKRTFSICEAVALKKKNFKGECHGIYGNPMLDYC